MPPGIRYNHKNNDQMYASLIEVNGRWDVDVYRRTKRIKGQTGITKRAAERYLKRNNFEKI